MKKIIVIEGTDSSGKETQTKLLHEFMNSIGESTVMFSFPHYSSESSGPVKMYLNGEIGNNPGDISPFKASVLFSVDRFITMEKYIKPLMEQGLNAIMDRYTTSNFIHQCAKFDNVDEKIAFIAKMKQFEYVDLGIKEPDIVIFLHMPHETALELMSNRNNKITGKATKDIHERDTEYMKKSYETAKWVSEQEGWNKIDCVDENGKLKTREQIHEEIKQLLIKKGVI